MDGDQTKLFPNELECSSLFQRIGTSKGTGCGSIAPKQAWDPCLEAVQITIGYCKVKK
jgi:hypothetical protein